MPVQPVPCSRPVSPSRGTVPLLSMSSLPPHHAPHRPSPSDSAMGRVSWVAPVPPPTPPRHPPPHSSWAWSRAPRPTRGLLAVPLPSFRHHLRPSSHRDSCSELGSGWGSVLLPRHVGPWSDDLLFGRVTWTCFHPAGLEYASHCNFM